MLVATARDSGDAKTRLVGDRKRSLASRNPADVLERLHVTNQFSIKYNRGNNTILDSVLYRKLY